MENHQLQIFNNYKIFIRSKINVRNKETLLKELYALYYKRLLFFIRSMVREDSEDLQQEVFIKVFEKLHTYNPLFSFNTWIYTITRNHCINHIQKKEFTQRKVTTSYIEEAHGKNGETPKKSLIKKKIPKKLINSLKNLNRGTGRLPF